MSSPQERTELGAPTSEEARATESGATQPWVNENAISGYRRGASIARYTVLGKLGEGAMGAVYSAYDPALDRKVALKLLRPHSRLAKQSKRERARKRLEREARALAKVSHPNVVQVHDAGVHEWGPNGTDFEVFVAMEHVDGVSVKQWQRTRPKPAWRAIVAVYIDACRGLAAAHEAGLVHRDVKPANILIGDDGRVRVVDFGLVAALSSASTMDSSGLQEDEDLLNRSLPVSSLEEPLTRTGVMMGTPAYMAPEQHVGVEIGPKIDQYAICVSLYEALYGHRPFVRADTEQDISPPQDLFNAKIHGEIAEPPLDSPVPDWLLAVLRRGMAPFPDDRYPSMHALIAALEDDPIARMQIRRRRAAIAAALLAVLSVALVGWIMAANPVDRCAGAGDAMDEIWNPSARERVRARLVSSGLKYAESIAARLTPRLDEYADQWRALRVAQCRGPSDALAPARALCMSRRQGQLAALVDVLAGRGAVRAGARSANGADTDEMTTNADAALVANAVQAVARLPLLVDCTDDNYVSARVPPPEDPALRQRVEALQPRLDRLEALYDAGQYQMAASEGEAFLDEMSDLDHPPFSAQVRYQTARAKTEAGDYAGAEALLKSAIRAAARGKHDVIVARAWAQLLTVVGYHQQRSDDAKPLREWVEMLASRADEPRTWALAIESIGIALLVQGDSAGALEHFERSLAIDQQMLGPNHPEVAGHLNNIGAAWRNQGDYARALEYYRRALKIDRALLGTEHPMVARKLNNIGEALRNQGDYAGALAHYRQALEINQNTLGPNHPDVAGGLNNIGVVLQNQGDDAAALKPLERALGIVQGTLGPEHPDVGIQLNNLGAALLNLEQTAAARDRYQRALEIFESALGADHVYVAYPRMGLGRAFLAEGDLANASAQLGRARAIFEAALGPEHPELALVLRPLSKLALAQGEPGRAVELVEQARALGNVTLAPVLALVLAEALWARDQPGDRANAVAAAAEAERGFAEQANQTEQAEAQAWLDAHPLR